MPDRILTEALPLARFAAASATPGIALSAVSTRLTHEAQFIPAIVDQRSPWPSRSRPPRSPWRWHARRCDFLYVATGVATAVGTGATLWLFIDSMRPSADVSALASIEIDLSSVELGPARQAQVARQALVWILNLVVLLLAIAALVRYLRE